MVHFFDGPFVDTAAGISSSATNRQKKTFSMSLRTMLSSTISLHLHKTPSVWEGWNVSLTIKVEGGKSDRASTITKFLDTGQHHQLQWSAPFCTLSS